MIIIKINCCIEVWRFCKVFITRIIECRSSCQRIVYVGDLCDCTPPRNVLVFVWKFLLGFVDAIIRESSFFSSLRGYDGRPLVHVNRDSWQKNHLLYVILTVVTHAMPVSSADSSPCKGGFYRVL